jgi:effector-binding domain-containing protein
MVIKASPEIVFNQVSYLKNWEKWSPWHKRDTAMKIIYEGPECGKGASYTWESLKSEVGNGKMIITVSAPYDSLCIDMFLMENKDTAKNIFRFEKDKEGTKATWIFSSNIGLNPISRYFGLFMNSMLARDFDKGLVSIDSICQLIPPVPELKIQLVKVTEQPYIGIKSSCAMADISKIMGDNYKQLMDFMNKSGVAMTKPPIAIYLNYSPEKIDFVSAIPVDKPVKPAGNIESGAIQAGNTVMAVHCGPYDNLEASYKKIEEWIKTNGKKVTGPPWEEYITDPSTEKDPSKWITNIYFPVE